MAPWDELRYFDTPKYTVKTLLINTKTLLISCDPRRIAVIFSTIAAAGNCQLVPVPLSGSGGGAPAFGSLFISNQSPWSITHSDFPGMPQAEWWGQCTVAGQLTITTVEIIVRNWPQPDPTADIGRMAKLLQYLGLRNGKQNQWPSRTIP